MSIEGDLLFSRQDFYSAVAGQERLLARSVQELSEVDISPENEAATVERLYKTCDLPCVEIRKGQITTSTGKGTLRLSQREAFMRDIDPGRELEVDVVRFHVPFSGDSRFFEVRPTSFNFNPPRAYISSTELVFTYPIRGDSAKMKATFEGELKSVEEYLKTLGADCDAFNRKLMIEIPAAIAKRREELAQKTELSEGLGIPEAMSDLNKPESDTVQFSSELAAKRERAKKRKWVRFTLAALEGIPWVGSLIGAATALRSEAEQAEVDELQVAWLESHTEKVKELEAALESIVEAAEKNSTEPEHRLEDESYLSLIRQGFRVWDTATSKEMRERVRRTLTNAAVSKLAPDDLIRLFLSWIEQYDETHFRIVGLLHRTSGLTRAAMWRAIDGRSVREDSREADLYRMIIRDLSTGSVIRQHRGITHSGDFLKKQNRGVKGQTSNIMKSAFDDSDQYELTELGHLFVGYALDEPSTALPD